MNIIKELFIIHLTISITRMEFGNNPEIKTLQFMIQDELESYEINTRFINFTVLLKLNRRTHN